MRTEDVGRRGGGRQGRKTRQECHDREAEIQKAAIWEEPPYTGKKPVCSTNSC